MTVQWTGSRSVNSPFLGVSCLPVRIRPAALSTRGVSRTVNSRHKGHGCEVRWTQKMASWPRWIAIAIAIAISNLDERCN